MLKSFRDTDVLFPCCEPAVRQSESLRALGSLALPGRE